MGTRTGTRADFEEFVAVRSGRLWRTAYLLTCDAAAGERLLEAGLARAWSRWGRLEAQPEHVVRAFLVEVATRWWRRRPRRVDGDGLWSRWTRLGRRERAVVVLRLVDGLDADAAADLLGCPGRAVGPLLGAALAHLGTDDPLPGLTAHGEHAEPGDLRRRLADVDGEVDRLRRLRRARSLIATTLAAAGVVAALSVVPSLVPDGAPPPVQPTPAIPSEVAPTPSVRAPRLVDRQLPTIVLANQVEFAYFASEESAPGRRVLRATVSPSREPQVLAWVSPREQPGRVVVSVDGNVVSRARAGNLVSGLVLAAYRPHLVVLRATRPGPDVRLGLAVYRWPGP